MYPTRVVDGKIALMGVLAALPLLGGLILFSFCLRLQNHTRITSFSMLSWSAIMVISSEVGFWFCLKWANAQERIYGKPLAEELSLKFKAYPQFYLGC